MLNRHIIKSFIPILLLVVIVLLIPIGGLAQNPILELWVEDSYACPGQQGVAIPLLLQNSTDTVFSFQMWMMASQPDLWQFVNGVDTTEVTRFWACDLYDGGVCTSWVECSNDWYCTEYYGDICIDSEFTIGHWHCWDWDPEQGLCYDSIFVPGYDSTSIDTVETVAGSLDTVGTLTSGWETMFARSMGGIGYDLKILGVADLFWPFENDGIPPRTEPGTLFRLYVNAADIPDTTTERTAIINLQTQMLDLAPIFFDKFGNMLGTRVDTVPDTQFFQCLAWADPEQQICLFYERVYESPYDSIFVDSIEVNVIDTIRYVVHSGTLTILKCMIGDANGDETYNLLDILTLIDDIYSKDYAPEETWKGDFNCDCVVNLLDILSLIDMLYTEPIGDPLPCRYPMWQALCEGK